MSSCIPTSLFKYGRSLYGYIGSVCSVRSFPGSSWVFLFFPFPSCFRSVPVLSGYLVLYSSGAVPLPSKYFLFTHVFRVRLPDFAPFALCRAKAFGFPCSSWWFFTDTCFSFRYLAIFFSILGPVSLDHSGYLSSGRLQRTFFSPG